MIKSNSFIEHLSNSKKQVETWPEWKKIDSIFEKQPAHTTQENSLHINSSKYQLKKTNTDR